MVADALTKKTPFYSWHERHGAVFYNKGGWIRPARYGEGPVNEHRRARSTGGIFDAHSMGKITVRGAHAAELLDRAATNDIAGLDVDRARYTCFCAPDGGIVDDLIVYRTGPDSYYLVTNTFSRERVLTFLRGLGGAEDHIEDVTSSVAFIGVQGPRSRDVLVAAGCPADLAGSALPYFGNAWTEIAGVEVLLARTGYTGELGYEVNFPAEYALDMWDHLCRAGEPFDVRPFGAEALMTLRLEKGYRSYGADIDDQVNPLEAGLGWAVRWGKPDFVGRDALELSRRDGLRRNAVYLRAGKDGFHPGDRLHGPDGEPVGHVTSGLFGPSLDAQVGLGYLDSASGPLDVVHTGAGAAVEVARRPYFDPAGERLRA